MLSLIAFFLFSGLGFFSDFNPVLLKNLFLGIALFIGMAYGMMLPAYNAWFVTMAPHNRRATASSTYLTSWDVGIGLGLLLGGNISQLAGFKMSFLVGSVMIFLSMMWYLTAALPYDRRHFQKTR